MKRSNTGTADLDVSSIGFGVGTSADFEITSGFSNIMLAPGANTTVQVAYSPSDFGTDSGTLVIASNDADEPTVTVSLSGNGVPAVPVPVAGFVTDGGWIDSPPGAYLPDMSLSGKASWYNQRQRLL